MKNAVTKEHGTIQCVGMIIKHIIPLLRICVTSFYGLQWWEVRQKSEEPWLKTYKIEICMLWYITLNPSSSLPTPPPRRVVTTCSSTQYTCSDGTCIDILRKCDGRPDCPHRDDESDCGM
jgi:hypothetical protein